MSSVSNRIVKNSIFLYIRLILSTAIAFIVVRLLLQSLGKVDYGIYSILAGAIAMFQMVNGTLVSSTMRFIVCAEGEQDEKKKNRIFNLVMRLHLWLGVIVALAMEISFLFFWDRLFNIPADRTLSAKVVYQFMAISVFVTFVSNPYEALIISHEKMLFFAVWGIVQSLGKLILSIILFIYARDRLILYGFGMMMIFCVFALWRWLFCRRFKESRISLKQKVDIHEIKSIFSYSGWVFCGNVSNTVLTSGSSLLLNRFFGVLVNAAEGVSAQISGQLSIFATTVMQAVNPVIMKYESAQNENQAIALSCTSSKMIGYIYIVMLVPFLYEADFVLTLWLKDVPDYTVVFARLTVIRILFTLLSTPFVTYLNATGHIRNFEICDTLIHFGTLFASYLWLKFGGTPVVVYVSLLICVITRMVFRVFWVGKESSFRQKDFWFGVFGRCISIGLMVMSLIYPVYAFIHNNWIRLFAVCGCSVVLVSVAVWFFGLSSKEQIAIRNLIKTSKLFSLA